MVVVLGLWDAICQTYFCQEDLEVKEVLGVLHKTWSSVGGSSAVFGFEGHPFVSGCFGPIYIYII